MALSSAVNKRPPARAAADNIMAMNSNPLPRNTVAKSRSSPSPIRSRTTPMNHRNAIAANGQQVQRHHDRLAAAAVSQPVAGGVGIARSRASHEGKSDREQNREDDPGDGSVPGAT